MTYEGIDYEELCQEIKRKLNDDKLILFIGAGVPASLKLPTWSELIEKIAGDMGYEPELFKQYGDYLSLAEYYRLNKGKLNELTEWMKRSWNVSDETVKKSAIYRYIVQTKCRLVYTTNYDHILEKAFKLHKKKYKTVIGVNDFTETGGDITQIIKFHGDYIKTRSLVLAECDYFERLNFESPLDIKLRSDMLTKSVLFIGYSLSDINIRLLIYRLNALWKGRSKNKPVSYIFLPTPNPIQEKIFLSRGIIPIVGEEVDRSKSLETFLEKIV